MRAKGVAVSQDATPPVVSISVPVDRPDTLYEAINKAEEKDLPGGTREQEDFFVQQNGATKKMGSIVGETYDAMVKSMADEISEVLGK